MKDLAESKSLWLALELAEHLHIEFMLTNTQGCKACTIGAKGRPLLCPECRAFKSALGDLQECMSTLFATGACGGET